MSGRMVRLLLEHVRELAGPEAVGQVLVVAGETRPISELDDQSWHSYAQFRALAEAAGAVLGGVERLRDIHKTSELANASNPETIETMHALGGPNQLLEVTGHNHGGLSNILVGGYEQVSPRHWVLRTHFKDGFAPFPEMCAIWTGMQGFIPRLFGFEATVLEEETCCLRGDEWCTVHLEWSEDSAVNRSVYLEERVSMLERRMQTFQATVSDLVSTDDVETVLSKVIRAASRASRLPAFVLALEAALPGVAEDVYNLGVDRAAADQVALQVKADPTGFPGLVSEVVSAQRRYGWLVAYDPARPANANEVVALEAYARLAATALDSATALAESRRQAATAQALLGLSVALADVASTEEMAVKVVRALPMVIDCDAATLLLRDGDSYRVAATYGFTAAHAAALRATAIPRSARSVQALSLVGRDDAEDPLGLMETYGVDAIATAPIVIDGEEVGLVLVAVRERAERLQHGRDIEAALRALAGHASTALRNARLLDQIRHQAMHDALTGLPNRTLILDRAESMLLRARRTRASVAALYIDLDGFKTVNDTLGHGAGDHLLKSVASRLAGVVRASDSVGRLGGDEFVILAESTADDGKPELAARRVIEVLSEPFVVDAHGASYEVTITASVGVAMGDRGTASELLRDADIALYLAKDAGKNRFVVFEPAMQAAARERQTLEADLRSALERDQFFLDFQPMVDLRTGATTGVESLVRWRHPRRGVISPHEFIPLLEDTGHIVEVGRWAIATACGQAARWHALGHRIDVSVNASARQFDADGLVDEIRGALQATGLPGSSLIIEITESTIMRYTPATIGRLRELRDLGVRIAIDDFGAGYSSLAHLRQLPADAIKIDRGFLQAAIDEPEASAIIGTLVQLGRTLGLETIAEGIESAAQFELLRSLECDRGQGFLFAGPLTGDQVVAHLEGAAAAPNELSDTSAG